MEWRCRDTASLLPGLGIHVEGGPSPMSHEDEQTIHLKKLIRVEVRKELDKMEWRYRDTASLVPGLGIHVEGGPSPMSHEVNAAYKQALLRFHPGRAVDELSLPKEQDCFLPIANVGHIMKKALPASAKISKGAKDTVQEFMSEFISFITGEASYKCQREKRETINGDDLLWAMTTLGFDEYVKPLKVYLQRFHETLGEKGGGGPSSSSSTPHHPVDSVAASMGIRTNTPRYAVGAPAMYGGRINDDDAGAADECPAALILPVSASPDDHAGKEQHVRRWRGGSFDGAGLN